MQTQKYPDGDCRRVGAGYRPGTSRGRGSRATAASRGGYGDLIRSGERRGAFTAEASSGGALGVTAAMALLARIIGRRGSR